LKIKLDENLGVRGKEIFNKYGNDTLSVYDQKLESSSDINLILSKGFSGFGNGNGK
jgi:hypothetical protein